MRTAGRASRGTLKESEAHVGLAADAASEWRVAHTGRETGARGGCTPGGGRRAGGALRVTDQRALRARRPAARRGRLRMYTTKSGGRSQAGFLGRLLAWPQALCATGILPVGGVKEACFSGADGEGSGFAPMRLRGHARLLKGDRIPTSHWRDASGTRRAVMAVTSSTTRLRDAKSRLR
jgi:hypothetical protein